MKGAWGLWRGGIMLNEGEGPVNFTMLFPWSNGGFFVYIYAFGKRWYWPSRNDGDEE
jgi:hypothetical protein